jgi:hypothetical protein
MDGIEWDDWSDEDDGFVLDAALSKLRDNAPDGCLLCVFDELDPEC